MIAELPSRAHPRSSARRPAARAPRPAAPETHAQPPRALARVLVSDDDPAIRELYARLLADHGFEVLAAPGGDARLTLELARRARPHLLITDLNKPGGLDGLALRAALRAEPRTARVPVLLISAVDLGRRAAALGPLDDQLPKPFGPEELVERAAALLPLTPADHDALAARALARRSLVPRHPVTGLRGLHGLAEGLPAATAAPGWAAAALGLVGRRALLRAYGRPQLDLLLGRLGDLARAAPGLLAGHLGLDGQIGLVGPAAALDAALAQIQAGFAPLAARLARIGPELPLPALAVRRAGPEAGPRPTLLDLRRALR